MARRKIDFLMKPPFLPSKQYNAETLLYRDRVIAACKELLDGFPVKDIAVEEVPVEDIIRQLFQRNG